MIKKQSNLSFVLPALYLNILGTEKILQFWDKMFSTCVILSAKEVRVKSGREFVQNSN